MLWGEGTARGGGGLEQRGQSCGPEGPYSAGEEPGSAVAAILMCSGSPAPPWETPYGYRVGLGVQVWSCLVTELPRCPSGPQWPPP